MARPLHNLTRANVDFTWGAVENAAFEELKLALTKATALAYIKEDPETSFTLETDASAFGLGAALFQKDFGDNGKGRLVAVQSKTLSTAEQNYSVIEKEALAVVWALKQLKDTVSISRHSVLVLVDHKPLTAIMGLWMEHPPNSRVAYWLEFLQPLNLDIRYQAGAGNRLVDGLSGISSLRRLPMHNFDQTELVIALLEEDGDLVRSLGLVQVGPLFYLQEEGLLRLYVPKKLRRELVDDVHRKGHFGSRPVLEVIRKTCFLAVDGRGCQAVDTGMLGMPLKACGPA